MLTRLIAYVRAVWARRRIDAEAEEELAFHLQQELEAHVARGLSPVEARREASLALGGLAQTRDAIRDVRSTSLDAIWLDLRHAARSLRATPLVTVVALATLALAIGASTTVFSVVDAVVLRELPFPRPDRLMAVGEHRRDAASDAEQNLVAPQNFIDWRAQQTVFTGLAAVGYASVSLRAEPGQEPETLESQAVTADFFSVLGIPPLLGRTFGAEHEVEGRAFVAVISHRLWQRRFGGTPDIIGRRLPGQRADFEIIGVMPPSFAFPAGATRPTDVWLPNVFRPEDRVRGNEFSYRLQVIARLRDGVTVEAAQAQMDRITRGLAAATPRWFENHACVVEPLRDALTRSVRDWMLMLLAGVGCVLLIACVNLANLMLVRASARARELATRAALGASRWDLVRVLLAESLLLSLGGAAVGVCAAWVGVETLRAAIPPDVPRAAAVGVDLRVLGAAVLTAVATGLLFGTAPILQGSRPRAEAAFTPSTRWNTASPWQHRLRGGLVSVEVALAVVLLVGAALFLASFSRVASVELGLDPRDVLTVRVRPLVEPQHWQQAQQRHRPMLRALLGDVRALPGIEGAALVNGGVPLRGDVRTVEFAVPGLALPAGEDIDFNEISPGYFQVMRVPLLSGRDFGDADRAGSEPSVILNEAAARRYFPAQDPIGRLVHFEGVRRVVGVVGNIRHDGPESAWRRQGFIPLDQSQAVNATLVMRLSRDAGDVLPRVKAAIWSHFPGTALPETQTLSHYLDALTARRRFLMLLLGLFGLLGVVIACVGIYGVMAYVVLLRRQEIGIRLALGALPAAILRSVLGRAAAYLAGGLAIGLPASWMVAASMSRFLFQVQPHEPWIYAAVVATLLVTGVAAALLPARAAARVDPLLTLRLE